MDKPGEETRVERARRYVREACERITRVDGLVERMRALGVSTESMEALRVQYVVWLEHAERFLAHEEEEARRRGRDE